MYIFPPITAIDVNHVPPIIHCNGVFLFNLYQEYFQILSIFIYCYFSIHSQTKLSSSPAKSKIHFLFCHFSPLEPSKLPAYGHVNT